MAPPHVIDLTREDSTDFRSMRDPLHVVGNRPIAKTRPAAKTKPASKEKAIRKAHVLLWIPHNGSNSSLWGKLKILGVYSSKEKATAERERVLARYEQVGHGDILIGDTWHDEIDIVVKPANCFFDEDRVV